MKGDQMRTKRRVFAATASLALLAACGGGGGGGGSAEGGGDNKAADITVPEAKGVNVDLGLAPNPNGFAFANFGAGASPEVFGAVSEVVHPPERAAIAARERPRRLGERAQRRRTMCSAKATTRATGC